jgi:hypothetical protein
MIQLSSPEKSHLQLRIFRQAEARYLGGEDFHTQGPAREDAVTNAMFAATARGSGSRQSPPPR